MTNRIIWEHSKRRDRAVLAVSVLAAAVACALLADRRYLLAFALAWWALIIAFMNQRPRLYARLANAQFWLRLVVVVLLLVPGLVWLSTRPVLLALVPAGSVTLISVAAGLACGSALTLVHFNDTRLLLSQDIISMQPRMAPIGAIFRPLFVVLMVPMEELYYRGLFITAMRNIMPGAFAVAISTVLFVTADWSGAWGPNSQRRRLLEGACLGLSNGAIFVLTGSLVGPIIAHYIYNLPQIILPIRNFTVHRRPGAAALEVSS